MAYTKDNNPKHARTPARPCVHTHVCVYVCVNNQLTLYIINLLSLKIALSLAISKYISMRTYSDLEPPAVHVQQDNLRSIPLLPTGNHRYSLAIFRNPVSLIICYSV